MNLIINNIKFEIEFYDTETANKIKEKLPINTIIENRWGDEIYFYTNFKINLSNNAKEVMEMGDIVYWRSQKSNKEAIAIFFGNTPKGEGNKPLAVSPCDVVGRIVSDFSQHQNIKKGDAIEIRNI